MKPHSTLAIEASGLGKAFGETQAVDGVDLAVRTGSVYGILGPNGAGKTTTVRMLATLLRPDEGEARVLGYDIVKEADEVRGAVSLTGQLASVDEDLTGQENLVLIGRLMGYRRAQAKARAAELLEAFDLVDAAGRLAKHYSGGMRRRLDIAASLVVTPRLMFLDEPTTGLDPRSRNQVWDIVRTLVADGTTVLLCTQYLDEADQLADGIAVIDHGKVIAEGTPAQLKASVGSGALHVRLLEPEQRPAAEQALSRALDVQVYLEPDPALSKRERPPRATALSACLTFGWRGMLKVKHVPEQLVDVTITPVLFVLMFTYIFGGAISGSTAEYLEFLLPGIMVMSVLFTTVYSGVALNTDVTKGVVDRFRSLPIPRSAPLVGSVLGDSVRYVVGAVVVVAVAVAVGFRPDGGVVGVVSAVALVVVFAFGLAWVFTTLGLLLRTPNAVMNAGFMGIFPLTFLSNVFVDPETLPGWLEAFVDVNPISHLVTASRGLMAGTSTGGDIVFVLISAAVLAAVFAPLTVRLYRSKS